MAAMFMMLCVSPKAYNCRTWAVVPRVVLAYAVPQGVSGAVDDEKHPVSYYAALACLEHSTQACSRAHHEMIVIFCSA